MRQWLVSLSLLWAATGCAANSCPPMPYENPIHLPPASPDFMWEQVVDVLDDYFEIKDEERGRQLGTISTVGRIETFPAIGSTLLEPWKGDSVTRYDRLECTLQSIRRRAVVQVIPTDDGGALIDVVVYKELEDLPQPEGAPTASATFRFDSALQRFSEPVGSQAVPLGWIGKGRDAGLEQKIIAQLVARGQPPKSIFSIFQKKPCPPPP
ncbi:MAG TPA: hypothetical protein VHY20_04745 [Pirellulales bacterium]|jgi:hypothetical protein|nr:hypothetical protein [Pirellulales bacterium]